ncbi:MAG TPA: HEAT repeat domain-containing protein [Polyangia bacterium]|nr:HEAT repeat domain-containing protein [Polyangia bacterium]
MRLIALRALVLLALLMPWTVPRTTAAADWTVKRNSNQALVEQAARAFAAAPDEAARATRLLRTAGRAGLAALSPLFARRAANEPAPYTDVEAYAQLLLLGGHAGQSIVWFTRAVTLRPDQAAPLVGRARALQVTGDRLAALASFEAALGLTSQAMERRPILQAMLPLLGQATAIEREVSVRRELCQLAPRDQAASDGLVAALARAGRPAEAADLLALRLHEGRGDRYDLGLRLADLREAAGDDDAAANVLAELRAHVPAAASERRRALWMRTLDVERRRGHLPELAATLARAPRPIEWDVLSHVRDELGDPEGALAAARQASALTARDLDVRRWTASLLDRMGQPEAAIAEYEALERLAPRDVRFAVEIIDRRFRRGQTAQARQAFDRSLVRFGNEPAALAELAQLGAHWTDDQRAIAAWQRLRHISPGDEEAIVGLGEMYFQRGKKESALRTWRELLRPTPSRKVSKGDAHLRLSDVLMDHDLFDEAAAEVSAARSLEPERAAPHRALAQLLERRHKTDDAVAEWEKVLALNGGSEHAGGRYEARARILALAARDGRGRLAQRVARLEEQARQHPQDRELALFVAEAQQRNGNVSGAITTLRAVIERDRTLSPPRDGQADAVVALVRLLRQTKQPDEAISWLQRLIVEQPSRAKDAELQMADIELGRYADDRALGYAEAAARLGPGDAQSLARVAGIQERAGRDAEAQATYRRTAADGSNAPAALGLARLLQRHGNIKEAAQILRNVLRTTTEEDVVNDAGHRALDLEEFLGTRDDFERTVAILAASGPDGSIYRRLFVDTLRRLVPPAYRAPRDNPADGGGRVRLARQGLRPLLESIADSEESPDPTLIELLGMLGNADAAPVLARIAAGPATPTKASPTVGAARPTPMPITEAQVAAVLALGRLGDERGRAALETQATAIDPGLRAAAIWSLGRITSPPSGDILLKAASDLNDEVAALACVGLGRLRDPRWTAALVGVAREPGRALLVRRAATVALGISGDRAATTSLLMLLDSDATLLTNDAASALGIIGDPRSVAPLLSHYLVGGQRSADAPELVALDRLLAGTAPDDDGKAIDGVHINVDAVLEALSPKPAAPRDRSPLVTEHRAEIGRTVIGALTGTADQKRNVLLLLDSRDDGLGLGALTPGAAPLTAPTTEALTVLGALVVGRLPLLVDDPDPEIRALALRIEAKLAPDPFPVAHIVRLAAMADQQPAAYSIVPAVEAARRVLRRHRAVVHPLVDAVTPLLASAAWQVRLAAVQILTAAHQPLPSALASDPNPLVRASLP